MANITLNDAILALLAAGDLAADDTVPVWDSSASVQKRATRAALVGATINGAGVINTNGKTMGVPADGTTALIDVAQTFTARPTLAAGATSGSQANVADDAAFSIVAPANYGILVLMVALPMTIAGMIAFRCQSGSAGQAAIIASATGTILDTRTDTVLTGTTGTDGKVTVSPNQTDVKIYIENRSGGARSFAWFFITN